MKSNTFAPKVFHKEKYTIVIQDTENGKTKTLKNIKAKTKNKQLLEIFLS
jgi:signal recognition particle subunit SEC65